MTVKPEKFCTYVYKPAALRFEIPGPPAGKERARCGKGGRHYTPRKTRDYENHVAQCGLNCLLIKRQERGVVWPTDKQVFMDLWIFHKNGQHKPDPDNVAKAIADGLSGVLWKNDKHVLPRVHQDTWPEDMPCVYVRIVFTGYIPGKGKLIKE